MKIFFLDGAGLFDLFILLGILFMVLASFLEAVVMILMKYNLPFRKAIGDSFLVNLSALGVVFLLLLFKANLTTDYKPLSFLLLYLISVIVEGFVLYGINRQKPVGKTLAVCLVMNLVSYLVFYLFTLVEA